MKESRRAAPFQPLTDSEWEIIEKILNDQRARSLNLRQVWDIVFQLNWTGSQQREVNRTWKLPWQSVYYYFGKWKNNTFLESLKDELLILRRIQLERKACPSALTFDSQSVKVTSFLSLNTGIDANKRINGRKRHLAVDTLGYPMALWVTGANISDTEAGKILADRVANKLADWTKRYETANRLALVRADAGYKTSFVDHVSQTHDWLVDIARGAPHKNQNRPKGSSHNQDAGRWKEVMAGSIFVAD